jgi:hypothetical protein
MFSFSKPRLVSIGMLLAILLISLMFSSYVEGLENGLEKAVAVVNKDAPVNNQALVAPQTDKQETDKQETDKQGPVKQETDGIVLGGNKLLTVPQITGALQNNEAVKQMLTSLPVKK